MRNKLIRQILEETPKAVKDSVDQYVKDLIQDSEFSFTKRLDLDGAFYLTILTHEDFTPWCFGWLSRYDDSDDFETIDNWGIIAELVGKYKIFELPDYMLSIFRELSIRELEDIMKLVNKANDLGMFEFRSDKQ